jgi:putative sigma-54 modulation protein
MKGAGFMKMNYTGKNMEVTDALRDVTEKKLSKLEKYFQSDISGNVTFSTEKNRKIIEVTINLPGTILRAEESSDDMYASIDKTVDILERQVRKHKTKLQKRYRNNDTIRFDNVPSLTKEEEEDKPKLVRRKRFGLKPMSSEEAILQMELLRHNFFVFMDADTEEVSVVYKRKDGNYGLIEPDFN